MKSLKIAAFILFASTLIIACANSDKKENAVEKKDSSAIMNPKVDSVKFTVAMVDNAKDPSCGMPTGAGIEDTAHLNNKVIGFCSKECKDDFMKNAAKNFAAVEWKK